MKKLQVFALIIVVSLLSTTNSFAYTVDDVRDIMSKERVDEVFTPTEIEEIIKQYNEIERKNLYADMFALGKTIDVDSKVEEEYIKIETEINKLRGELAENYKSGSEITEVLKIKTELETALHRLDSIRKIGVEITLDYIENIWSDKYNKVQNTIKQMSEDYEIGDLGNGLRSPLVNGFMINSPFGLRLDPITQDKLIMHNGVDLHAYLGEPVMAQWNGVVSNTYTSEISGNVIEVTHGRGLKTYYMHLDEIIVEMGQEVKQYDIIGKAGSTGYSTGPHLHLIVELDGEKINPVYLYGSLSLNAFKAYLSDNPERNRELYEVESNIKKEPTKQKEEIKEEINVYYRPSIEKQDGSIDTKVIKDIKLTPFDPTKPIGEDLKKLKESEKTEVKDIQEETGDAQE